MSVSGRVELFIDEVLQAADAGTFTVGFFDEKIGAERIKIGDLVLKTGEVIVADPLVAPIDNAPFDCRLPLGKYSADAIIGIRPDGDRRLGLSMLSTPTHKPVSWELASQVMSNAKGKTIRDAAGVLVDSGLASYFDRTHLDLVNALAEQESGREHIQRTLAKMGTVLTYECCKLPLLENDEANAMVFSTGDGDGQYQSYFGVSSDGTTCAIVTDFLIFRMAKN